MQIITQSLGADTQAYLRGYLRQDAPQATYPAMIIVPGGSYTHIPEQQAEDLAMAWFARGYQAFFLRYSFAGEKKPLLPAPVVELARSVASLREHAADWQIDAAHINVAGFSVGGHIVALFNDLWATDHLNQLAGTTPTQIHPHAILLGYPVITPQAGFPNDAATLAQWTDDPAQIAADQRVTAQNAPTFAWVTANDPLVPVQNTLAYVQASLAHGVDTELHIFHNGPHGLALANQVTAWKPGSNLPHVAHWIDLATEWLADLN
ncbi:alpha/beta hydrolase [Levilactobacillus namurensis]|uniref:alpha/beta hydrolase n=1 Tax=Levilactobacillus namurensis TaxID=380393 RepID=UPI0022304B36|nr:alpha/beta hydrolase [Levilactobacillus namurensis]MCW3777774.1 alpha/beta hydrolase [Levilactobacillus namurensis]